jgi:amino acid transporter
MSMSRDGLLPKRFSKYIKIQNASYATIVTGFVVAVQLCFELNFGY